jgi:hypothetical protein
MVRPLQPLQYQYLMFWSTLRPMPSPDIMQVSHYRRGS